MLAEVPFHAAGTEARLGWQISPGTNCGRAGQGVNGFKDCPSQYGTEGLQH